MQDKRVPSLSWDPLEKAMASYSSILAWKIQNRGAWRATEVPRGLEYVGSQRVRPTEHGHEHIVVKYT